MYLPSTKSLIPPVVPLAYTCYTFVPLKVHNVFEALVLTRGTLPEGSELCLIEFLCNKMAK